MIKTLLVLAASIYQVPTIETAKRLGYRVITVDNNPSNPGHGLAAISFNVDTTDVEGVLNIAGNEKIDGVIAPCTDVAVSTAAAVAEKFGLNGPSIFAARVLTQKYSFRQFQRNCGLPSPAVIPVTKTDSPNANIFNDAKWIMKPNRASGSKGVFILENSNDFRRHLNESIRFSSDGMAILETYLHGTQHTCEGVLQDGKVVFFVVTDRTTASPPHTATAGHYLPSNLSNKGQSNIKEAIEFVFTRLAVTNCVFDCDFVSLEDEVTIIEMTPRLGGNSLSSLIQTGCNFDLIEYAVLQACGDLTDSPNIIEKLNPAAVLILGVNRLGKLKFSLDALESFRKKEWVKYLTIDFPAGQAVEPFINSRNRVGEALIVGNGRIELEQRELLLRSSLEISVL